MVLPVSSMTYLKDYADPVDIDALEAPTLPGVQKNSASSDLPPSTKVKEEIRKQK